jgi:hypothetical protein
MSPALRSSRPHTGVGTCGTRSSSRCARAGSSVSRRGLPTASSTSGICPSRQRRISYRKIRNRPAQRVPTGPSATTPRCSPRVSRTGACSITNRAAATRTSSAEWYRSHAGRRSARAATASNTRPLSRTKCPPAPSGNQYRSTAACSGPAAALKGVPMPEVATRQRSHGVARSTSKASRGGDAAPTGHRALAPATAPWAPPCFRCGGAAAASRLPPLLPPSWKEHCMDYERWKKPISTFSTTTAATTSPSATSPSTSASAAEANKTRQPRCASRSLHGPRRPLRACLCALMGFDDARGRALCEDPGLPSAHRRRLRRLGPGAGCARSLDVLARYRREALGSFYATPGGKRPCSRQSC